MSDASKCDKCGALYEAEPKKTISLDVHVATDTDCTYSTWSDVDLCPTCSASVLALIKPALNDFDKAEEPS